MASTRSSGRIHFATPEQEDARWRLAQQIAPLIERRDQLEVDRDDPRVLSELTMLDEQLKRLEREMCALDADGAEPR
jgi:hypothetical protein